MLTADDIEELGQWELDEQKSEAVVDRLTAQPGEHRQGVREVLGSCLRDDVWGDYAEQYAAAERRYRDCREDVSVIVRSLGRPPTVYSFLCHSVIGLWRPEREQCGRGLIIEDEYQGATCKGHLVAQGMAFPTTLALLETSARQEWRKWRSLWEWF
jgi:hypothetical protein